MLEYACDLDLPMEIHEHPAMREIKLAGNDILTWANDIYSFPVRRLDPLVMIKLTLRR